MTTCCAFCRTSEAACDQRPRCCDFCRHDQPGEHRVVRYADQDGYVASCVCGWRTTRPTRERRDADVAAHAGSPDEPRSTP